MVVSAIISAYYCADLLQTRIENLFDCEVVVVCQEDSEEHAIAKKMVKNIVTTPDIPTIGKAWNLGIQAAAGDYVTTANSDDLFYYGYSSRMAEILYRHPAAGLIFGDCDLQDRAGIHAWKRMYASEGLLINFYETLKTRCVVGPMPMWRKSLHNRFGYFNESYIVASDYSFWLRLARGRVGFYYLPEVVGLYVLREDSLEHRNTDILRQEKRLIQCETE